MSDPATSLPRPATAAIQHAFVAIMPRIVRHARLSFRYMACDDASDNAIAETVALTWKWFVGLVQKGKHPEEFVSVLATYAARAVKSRRSTRWLERIECARLYGFATSAFPLDWDQQRTLSVPSNPQQSAGVSTASDRFPRLWYANCVILHHPPHPSHMVPAHEVAKHLIHLAAADPEGEPMTAMRLHKLLYYCQGWYLAWYGVPLFPEKLEAWKYGPVVPEVYELPWGHGRDPLPLPSEPDELPTNVRKAVDQVWAHYCRFSTCGLRDMTHEEPPWKNHYTPDAELRCSKVIPTDDLAAFFGSEFKRTTGETPGTMGQFEADVATGRLVSLEALREELGW